jgi:hypothetical protein
MTGEWKPRETTTHQDHVIAHVLGATVLGYFTFDEALYILLDIGFVWTIFLDGEMSLLPHPVTVSEFEMDQQALEEIKGDIDRLLTDSPIAEKLLRMKTPPAQCQIEDVNFFEREDQRRLVIKGEQANLAIETSLATAKIDVYELGK